MVGYGQPRQNDMNWFCTSEMARKLGDIRTLETLGHCWNEFVCILCFVKHKDVKRLYPT